MNSAASIDLRAPQSWLSLAAFLVVVIGIGALIGTSTSPDGWYEGLEKPPFNPPNWLFGPVWFILYVGIAIAGWLVFLKAPRSPAMAIWVAQMVANWAWSPTWFRLHQVWLAFAIILVILALIVSFIVLARKVDWRASALFVPYLAWVGFASLLNLSIGLLN